MVIENQNKALKRISNRNEMVIENQNKTFKRISNRMKYLSNSNTK